jgi:hypothetical protein
MRVPSWYTQIEIKIEKLKSPIPRVIFIGGNLQMKPRSVQVRTNVYKRNSLVEFFSLVLFIVIDILQISSNSAAIMAFAAAFAMKKSSGYDPSNFVSTFDNNNNNNVPRAPATSQQAIVAKEENAKQTDAQFCDSLTDDEGWCVHIEIKILVN